MIIFSSFFQRHLENFMVIKMYLETLRRYAENGIYKSSIKIFHGILWKPKIMSYPLNSLTLIPKSTKYPKTFNYSNKK